MVPSSSLEKMLKQARLAQREFESFTQSQVDAIVKEVGKYVYDHAEMLAKMAIEDTQMGNLTDKIQKNKAKSSNIWNHIKHAKSRGIIGEDPARGLIYVAKPMGVVGAITPVTNPIVTPMCNILFALKCANAIIVAPHPKAERCAAHLVEAFMHIVKRHGGPDGLIQSVTHGSIEMTQELMRQVDVVVATGGKAMVTAAYSSGKPAFGVGPGNVPVIVDTGIDYAAAVGRIAIGASFDNGLICSREQCVFVPEAHYKEIVHLFLATQKVWYTDDPKTTQKVRDLVFAKDGNLQREVVGMEASKMAAKLSIHLDDSIRLLLLKVDGPGEKDLLCREKLSPVLGIYPYRHFSEALEFAAENLEVAGKGHSAAIHSENEEHIRTAGLLLSVSRLVVNQSSSLSAGGSPWNGFAASTTLGCGSWGGNSISENLDYKHLMNISRIGKVIPGKKAPISPEEIWK